MTSNTTKQHQRREQRNRAKIRVVNKAGRPRLSVFRSGKNIYAQIIDDEVGETLVSASTLENEAKAQINGNGSNIEAARIVGELIAKKAKSKNIVEVVFDRGGFEFHGRIKALAEAARSELKF